MCLLGRDAIWRTAQNGPTQKVARVSPDEHFFPHLLAWSDTSWRNFASPGPCCGPGLFSRGPVLMPDPLSAPRLRRPGLKKLDLCNRLARRKVKSAKMISETTAFQVRNLKSQGRTLLWIARELEISRATPAKWFRGECQCGGNFTGVPPPPRRETVWKRTSSAPGNRDARGHRRNA